MTDEQLSRLATNGDQEAFLELFTRHEHGLLNFCHRLTGNREDAADLVQESFLRVFARLPALEGRDVNLAAYLRRTARNLAYDAASGRVGEVMVDDMEVVAGADDALEADPERAMLLGDQQAAVQRANAALPERHRLALALRELEDMDYAQIGEVLEVTPDAVGQILVRARLGLRRQLRLASVDEERMAPACRARLGEVGALIDGQLDHDRAHVLRQHLAACATCAQVRAAFEDARIRYRAWLPIPLIMGLGLSTLRTARDRGLLEQFTDSISWGDDGGAGGQLGGAGQEVTGGAGMGGAAGGGGRVMSQAAAGGGGAAGIAGAAADSLWGSW
ncbi:MAG: sigma-70 family RNA polymerase sigma factor [Thermoleophilia bacterium]|nr:sigma-70 family RNA polymerase sigma factor [Thermoleophilia bacterium]